MCKPSMFSYWAGVWQTEMAKRAKFHAKGTAPAAIGWVRTGPGKCRGRPHRASWVEADRRATSAACWAGSALLARRDRQEPHQQPKQKQGADQRKQGVPGVKMEVGIAIETMPRRQHRPFSARDGRAQRGDLTTRILPPICHFGCCFFRLCGTPYQCPNESL